MQYKMAVTCVIDYWVNVQCLYKCVAILFTCKMAWIMHKNRQRLNALFARNVIFINRIIHRFVYLSPFMHFLYMQLEDRVLIADIYPVNPENVYVSYLKDKGWVFLSCFMASDHWACHKWHGLWEIVTQFRAGRRTTYTWGEVMLWYKLSSLPL